MKLLDNTGLNHLIDIIKNAFANVEELIAGKVDKVDGKGLSSNDYTATEKNKLSGIEAGAQKNTVTSVNGKTGAVVITIPTYKITETRTTYTTTSAGIVSRSITGYDSSTCTLDVYINGFHCIPGVHYNISGTTVTTIKALESGQVCEFVLRKVTT